VNVVLIPPSDVELDEAIKYYDEQYPGLGEDFYREFLRATDLVIKYPDTWRKVSDNTRRMNIKNFPYLLLYIIDGETILITCIAHQHRDPSYFADRL